MPIVENSQEGPAQLPEPVGLECTEALREFVSRLPSLNNPDRAVLGLVVDPVATLQSIGIELSKTLRKWLRRHYPDRSAGLMTFLAKSAESKRGGATVRIRSLKLDTGASWTAP